MRAIALRAGLLVPLLLLAPLAGCGDDEPAVQSSFTPLSYAYLRPLRLNVGAIGIVDAQTPLPDDLSGRSPAIPAEALRQMAQDRLLAAGASGRASFTIQQASILRQNGMLNGLMRVRLDIYTSDGQRAAYAEAAVARAATAPDDGDAALRAALYELTRQMMSDMNVELEFQLRRSIGDWLQTGDGPAPAPAAVQQQSLAPPPGTTASPVSSTGSSTGSSIGTTAPDTTAPDTTAPGSTATPGFRLVPSPPPTQ